MPLDQWIPAAANAASEVAQTGMGLLFGGLADQRQRRQQGKLNKMNIAYNKEMTEYNMMKQLEMWEKTGYKGQMEQLKRAGLNPALMYGGAGGGGGMGVATSNNAPEGAPKGGNEAVAMAGMGMQSGLALQMMKAQKENIEADTKQKEAEAAATSGVRTEEGQARIAMLQQGVKNEAVKEQILKVEQTLKEIDQFEQNASQSDRLDYITYNTEKARKEMQMAQTQEYVTRATRDEQVRIIEETAVGAVLRNALTEAQTEATKTGMSVDQQKIKESVNKIMQGWDSMERQDREIMIKQTLRDFQTDLSNDVFKSTMGALGEILEGQARGGKR